MSRLSGRKVLVTGATGFIGGRLVEKLVLEEGAHVRALVRDFSHASRLARFPLPMIAGGLLDEEALDRAVAGCEVVFHCAHDFDSSEANLAGTRRLAEACLRHKVQRLVYTSSISVYEPLPEGELDESAPPEPSGWTYKDDKIAAERLLDAYHREWGLPVVTILPTIVYGPFGKAWTIAPVTHLRQTRVVLSKEKPGRCNALYVDDCVDALLLAGIEPAAVGERILVSGPDTVTWHEFYRTYERMLGTHSLVFMDRAEMEKLKKPASYAPNRGLSRGDPRRLLEWAPARRVYKTVWKRFAGEALRDRTRKVLPVALRLPSEQQLALFEADTRVRTDRARKLLGFAPKFSFERGMALTEQFVKWAAL